MNKKYKIHCDDKIELEKNKFMDKSLPEDFRWILTINSPILKQNFDFFENDPNFTFIGNYNPGNGTNIDIFDINDIEIDEIFKLQKLYDCKIYPIKKFIEEGGFMDKKTIVNNIKNKQNLKIEALKKGGYYDKKSNEETSTIINTSIDIPYDEIHRLEPGNIDYTYYAPKFENTKISTISKNRKKGKENNNLSTDEILKKNNIILTDEQIDKLANEIVINLNTAVDKLDSIYFFVVPDNLNQVINTYPDHNMSLNFNISSSKLSRLKVSEFKELSTDVEKSNLTMYLKASSSDFDQYVILIHKSAKFSFMNMLVNSKIYLDLCQIYGADNVEISKDLKPINNSDNNIMKGFEFDEEGNGKLIPAIKDNKAINNLYGLVEIICTIPDKFKSLIGKHNQELEQENLDNKVKADLHYKDLANRRLAIEHGDSEALDKYYPSEKINEISKFTHSEILSMIDNSYNSYKSAFETYCLKKKPILYTNVSTQEIRKLESDLTKSLTDYKNKCLDDFEHFYKTYKDENNINNLFDYNRFQNNLIKKYKLLKNSYLQKLHEIENEFRSEVNQSPEKYQPISSDPFNW